MAKIVPEIRCKPNLTLNRIKKAKVDRKLTDNAPEARGGRHGLNCQSSWLLFEK
jgi:hypothetical protein